MQPSFLLVLLYFFSLSVQLSAQEEMNLLIDPRDSSEYEIVSIEHLLWMRENLRFETEQSIFVKSVISKDSKGCGQFYLVEEAFEVCPKEWRLPTESEVKRLFKLQKRKRLELIDTLSLKLCGRVDNESVGKMGEQNTFWMDAPLEEGYISHWHTFGEEQKIHSHDVVNARRQFPVRCVREISSSH